MTCVILASFATIVGVLADGQVRDLFIASMNQNFQSLEGEVQPFTPNGTSNTQCSPYLQALALQDNEQIRLIDMYGTTLCSSTESKHHQPLNSPALVPPLGSSTGGNTVPTRESGYEVYSKWISWGSESHGWLVFARPLSSIDQTESRIRVFLGFGVLGGAILALLAGLYTAQRAMRPIAELTDAAREIELTRDPTRRIPHPEAEDEVAELALTLEGMLSALGGARAETEAALNRQREFVADASHELRTPLTSVLANLELLADELEGEQAESAKSALRSTRRMRRLVGDLLLLARADAGRAGPDQQPHRSVDLAEVLTDAAGELGPVAADHHLTIDAGAADINANRDDVHRLILNLIENAINHTPPGTAIHAATATDAAGVVLIVEDQGPGISPELQRRVFDRFVRGQGDGGRGTGLGLAIVRAVADSHAATVELVSARETGVSGTRFEVRFPPAVDGADAEEGSEPAQTSTTTGRTIGRRLRRS